MSLFSQLFPPAPSFTETSLPDLIGKVYIVTGSASGVGLELARILYSKNATVHIGARSLDRCKIGINAIKAACPGSKGRLVPMVVDLADSYTVRTAVEVFLENGDLLHGLIHNAAVMVPQKGARTSLVLHVGPRLGNGNELPRSILTNKALEGILKKTAAVELSLGKKATTRIAWVSSMINANAPKGGVIFNSDGNPKQLKGMENYMQTKAGVAYLAVEFARRLGDDGILNLSLHPGLMMTDLQRHLPPAVKRAMGLAFKGPLFGAYTELYAVLSPELTILDNGKFLVPWGRRGCLPSHMIEGSKRQEEGGAGISHQFYDWCERQTMCQS